MTYAARILADSIAHGVRLTTLEVTMPRIVLAEFNTHRMLSRNSASSRAIPVEKRIAAIRANPFVPEAFAANQRGMQAGAELGIDENRAARVMWLAAMAQATNAAADLALAGVHKQWANRLIEPYAWHTCIVTATEWDNFFALRCSSEAQPEIRRTAELMREAMAASAPREVEPDAWHLPMIAESMGDYVFARTNGGIETLVKLSVARCARVSYLTHDGQRDPRADLELYDRLVKSGHMSPLEHAAYVAVAPRGGPEFYGNFRFPWIQARKLVPGESVFGGAQ